MEFDIIVFLVIILAGFLFGLISIMVGIGGGLMNVPFLIFGILLFPSVNEELDPRIASLISSFVIIFTATSGFLKYRSQKRIDFKTVLSLLYFAVPGAIVGAIASVQLDASLIKFLFAILVGFAAIRGILKALSNSSNKTITEDEAKEGSLEKREIIDEDGVTHSYYVRMKISKPIAFVGGFVAGLLGVGGGIVYMPLMLSITGVPVHIAVATSATMIIVVSFVAVVTKSISLYAATGSLELANFVLYGLPLAIGSVIGARLGATYLKKLNSRVILVAFWSIALISALRMGLGAISSIF